MTHLNALNAYFQKIYHFVTGDEPTYGTRLNNPKAATTYPESWDQKVTSVDKGILEIRVLLEIKDENTYLH